MAAGAGSEGTLVSVMIPTYKRRNLVQAAVRSALDQTHPHVEVCVVDDASDDGTAEALAPLVAERGVRFERNPTNLGMVPNFNRCFELAKGELVVVLPSDDLIDPGFAAACVEVCDRHPSVGMVLAPVRAIAAAGEELQSPAERPRHHAKAGDEAVQFLFSVGCPMITTMFRKRAIDEVGPYDESIWGGPEVELAARVASKWDVYDLGVVLGSYRKHVGNLGPAFFRRDDLLQAHLDGLEKTWSYLSRERLDQMGIGDLRTHVRRIAAGYGVSGAVVNLAAGDRSRARDYLARVRNLDADWWRTGRYWKIWLAACTPVLGPWEARRRLAALTQGDGI